METISEQFPIIAKQRSGFNVHPELINRRGRPIGPESQKKKLQDALRWAGRKHGNISFLHHIAKLAYEDRTVALAILNKLMPNAEAIEKLVDGEKELNKVEVNIVYNGTNPNVSGEGQRQANKTVDLVAETESRFTQSS